MEYVNVGSDILDASMIFILASFSLTNLALHGFSYSEWLIYLTIQSNLSTCYR